MYLFEVIWGQFHLFWGHLGSFYRFWGQFRYFFGVIWGQIYHLRPNWVDITFRGHLGSVLQFFNLSKGPIRVKAGRKFTIKIPFEANSGSSIRWIRDDDGPNGPKAISSEFKIYSRYTKICLFMLLTDTSKFGQYVTVRVIARIRRHRALLDPAARRELQGPSQTPFTGR